MGSMPDDAAWVLVNGLTRTQIVQFAGAVGDFNPIHTDEVYATEVAQLPTVMAHGMLTMGLAGEALAQWVDQDSVTAFGGRFKAPVWPGDTLTVSLKREDGDEADATHSITLVVTKQSGAEVFVGYARLRA
jgi:acyl dehydratase